MLRKTAAQDGTNNLAQLRDSLYSALPEKGKKAQGTLVLWLAGLEPRLSSEEIDQIVTHDRMQFVLKLPDVAGSDIADAAQRAASELGLWTVSDALYQPAEKLMLIMAVG